MAKVCQVTGKKASSGYSYTTRGIAKKKKGIGIKITGKTLRRFQPNLKKKRIWDPEKKTFTTLRLSTAAMRTIKKRGFNAVMHDMCTKGKI